MNRIKNKQKDSCINLDSPTTLPSAIQSTKLPTHTIKASLPIVTHQKEKERVGKTEVINVEEESAKMNCEIYKNAIFRTDDKIASKKPYVQS
jgi:hypothetical protein